MPNKRRQWRAPNDAFVGTNVFVLFDTSNYMYRGFVYASDAIADFVRGLDRADSVAVYTYSRNLTRAAPLSQGAQRRDLRPAQGRGGRRFGALQLPAADAARRGQSPGAQSGDRVLERPRQRQHGGAGRRARGGRGRGHSDLRDLHQRSEQGSRFRPTCSGASPRAPAANPTSPRPGRSRWKRSRPSARIWATPTPSRIIRSRTRTKDSARSRVEVLSDAGKKYRVQCRPGYRPQGGFDRARAQ